MLRIGMIGAGMVSRHHLLGWRTLGDRARVVAITDPVAASAQARAREFGIDMVYPDARSMLASAGLDAVDIVAPRGVHAELVRLSAGQVAGILCQKPLAPTLPEAEALIRDLGTGTRLMVHENWRFRPYYRQVAQWIAAGAIGRPLTVDMALLTSGLVADRHGRRPALERQPFMRSERRMLVAEVLIHHLDVLRFLFGPLTVVSARLRRHCPDIAGEDTALIHLSADGGALITLLASMAVAGHPPGSVDRLAVAGDRGAIELADHVLTRSGPEPAVIRYDPDPSYQAAYDRTIAHFVDALASGAPFETGPEDNIHTLRLVEAVYRLAAAEGEGNHGRL